MKRVLLLVVLSVTLASAVTPVAEIGGTIASGCKLKVGDAYAGGIVFYVDPVGCHGLVCAPSDQSTQAQWSDARSICESFILNGYSDWRLPSDEELDEMYSTLYKSGIGDFSTNYYWSSSVDNNGLVYAQYFCNAYQNVYRYVSRHYLFHVRAVRAF